MDRLLTSLTALIIRRHKVIFCLSIAISILSILLVARLELKTDMLDVLPSKNPRVVEFKDFLLDFGSSDRLIAVVESKKGGVLENIDAVEALAKMLTASSMTAQVDYNIMQGKPRLFLEKFPLFLNDTGLKALSERLTMAGMERQLKVDKDTLLSPLASPLEMELIGIDPLNIRSIVMGALKHNGSYSPTGYYLSRDKRLLLMLIKPRLPAKDMKFMGGFTSEMNRIKSSIEKDFGTEIKIGFTGPYAFAMEAQSSLKKDLFKNFAISAILVILLFQIVYKKRTSVLLLTISTLFAALSCTLAFSYLLFGGLNMVSSIVAITLIPMGIDYIIHIFNRWEAEYGRCKEKALALEITFQRVLPGVITGALTTSAAFLSIMVTDFKGLHEFGIIAGTGVIFCLIATVFFLCSALIWFAPALRSHKAKSVRNTGLMAIIIKRQRIVTLTGAAVIIIAAISIPRIGFDSDPESLGIKNSPSINLQKKVSAAFGNRGTPLIAVTHKDTDKGLIKSYDDLERITGSIYKGGDIGGYSSLNLFIPPPSQQRAAIKSLKNFPILPSELKQNFFSALKHNGFKMSADFEKYIDRVSGAIKIREPARLSDISDTDNEKISMFYNRGRKRIASYIYPSKGKWDDKSIMTVSGKLRSAMADITITGAPVMLRALKGGIIKDSILASILTFFIITLLVYLCFRSIKWSVVILSSITCIFILFLGTMSLIGLPFNYINIGVIALIFGIGVDYSIYMVQGCLEEGAGLVEGFTRTSKSILMCALTTMAGFGTLMTMSFRGIASFGETFTLGLLVCLISTLFFLPAVISLFSLKER